MSKFTDSLYTIPEKEISTYFETYEQCEIYKTEGGEFLLGSERYKRFVKKYATVELARTAITKRFTRVNNVYARNYLNQTPKGQY